MPPRTPTLTKEALSERAEARAKRWAMFEQTLGAAALREHLAHLRDFEDVDALDKAFALTLETPRIYAALRFLVEWPRLDLAERLVVARRPEWERRRYEILAPAAEALASCGRSVERTSGRSGAARARQRPIGIPQLQDFTPLGEGAMGHPNHWQPASALVFRQSAANFPADCRQGGRDVGRRRKSGSKAGGTVCARPECAFAS